MKMQPSLERALRHKEILGVQGPRASMACVNNYLTNETERTFVVCLGVFVVSVIQPPSSHSDYPRDTISPDIRW